MPDDRTSSGLAAEPSPGAGGTEATLRRSDEQVSIEWRGERLLMHIPSCTYVRLGATSARIWDLLERPRTVSQLCAALIAEHGVDRKRCVADVLELAHDLKRRGLLIIDPL